MVGPLPSTTCRRWLPTPISLDRPNGEAGHVKTSKTPFKTGKVVEGLWCGVESLCEAFGLNLPDVWVRTAWRESGVDSNNRPASSQWYATFHIYCVTSHDFDLRVIK